MSQWHCSIEPERARQLSLYKSLWPNVGFVDLDLAFINDNNNDNDNVIVIVQLPMLVLYQAR